MPQETYNWFSTPVLEKKTKVQFSSIVQSFLSEYYTLYLAQLPNSIELDLVWVQLKYSSIECQQLQHIKQPLCCTYCSRYFFFTHLQISEEKRMWLDKIWLNKKTQNLKSKSENQCHIVSLNVMLCRIKLVEDWCF